MIYNIRILGYLYLTINYDTIKKQFDIKFKKLGHTHIFRLIKN